MIVHVPIVQCTVLSSMKILMTSQCTGQLGHMYDGAARAARRNKAKCRPAKVCRAVYFS